MKIVFQDRKKLIIAQPDIAHKAQTYIFTGIGLIGIVSVIGSGAEWYNGILFYLLLFLGMVFLKLGDRASVATFDKENKLLETLEHPGLFSQPKIEFYRLDDIESCEFDGTHFLSLVSDVSNRKGFAIILKMKNGKTVYPLPYANGKKKCETVFTAVKDFIEA